MRFTAVAAVAVSARRKACVNIVLPLFLMLMDGGMTAAYWYGDVAEVRA